MIDPDSETADSDASELPSPIGEGELVSESEMKPFSIPTLFVIFMFGVVGPVVCHLITLLGAPDEPEWQSGNLDDKLGFLLACKCGWPMFPLLGFSIFCLGKVGLDERQAAKSWVRFGVFTGVPITAWYLFAFSLSFGGGLGVELVAELGTQLEGWFRSLVGLLIAAGFLLALIYGFYWTSKVDKFGWGYVVVALVVCAALIVNAGSIAIAQLVVLFVSLPFILPLVLSTPLAFLVYLGMSIRIFVKHRDELRFSIAELMVAMTWLGGFFGAARAVITMSLIEYEKLPLEPPERCYVATAAAQGHPTIVKSIKLPATKGQSVFVNQQLTTFKTAELTLRSISPSAHRVFRFIYNRVGPPLATMLNTPMLATLTYLSLKPAEWSCWLCLRILLGGRTLRRTKNLYFERAAAVVNSRSHEKPF